MSCCCFTAAPQRADNQLWCQRLPNRCQFPDLLPRRDDNLTGYPKADFSRLRRTTRMFTT